MLRISTFALVVAIGSAVGIGGANYHSDAAETYLTAPVERGSIANVVKATGTLNPVQTVDVSSQLSGWIAEVLVGFNDPVTAGQVIARLDPRIYAARVSEARAALNIAKANVEMQRASLERAQALLMKAQSELSMGDAQTDAVKARLTEAELKLTRKQQLWNMVRSSDAELTKAQSERDVEAANLRASIEQGRTRRVAIAVATSEVSMAQANLLNAQAVVEQKQAALEQAQLDLERTAIKAPIDGIIIKRDINPGQTVAVSLKAETQFKIANDLREMEVHGRIDEADVGRLKEGQPATFTVDAYPEQVFTGRVTQVRKAPEVTQSVVTYTVVISAPNPDQVLFPGMTANLRITITETPIALKVPHQALRFKPADGPDAGSGSTVWVVGEDGKPSAVPVQLGDSDERGTQVIAGSLREGQEVIVGKSAPRTQAKLPGLRFGL